MPERSRKRYYSSESANEGNDAPAHAREFGDATPAPRRTIYLNNAATSWPKAPGVADAVYQVLAEPPVAAGRSTLAQSADTCPLGTVMRECRELVAAYLGVDDFRNVVLTTNDTHGLNLAIWGVGLTLPPGAHIITSVAEHNSVLRPLRHLQKWREVRVMHIGLDAEGGLDQVAFTRAIAEAPPALVVLSHASNVSGRVYDVAPLFHQAKAAGAVTLLDAAQTSGHFPLHPATLGADMLAFPGHKGFHGPPGVGVLYVAAGVNPEPLIVGGTGSQSEAYYQPEAMPLRLEAGTPNVPAIAGFAAALRWHTEEGAAFRQREQHLHTMLKDGLRQIDGVTLFDDHPDASYTPAVSLRITGYGVEELGHILTERFGIICRPGLHCAPLMHQVLGTAPEGTVRLSVSGFTTEEEVAYTVGAIESLC